MRTFHFSNAVPQLTKFRFAVNYDPDLSD